MRFKRLDLNLLVALDVLLREKSITRAGRQLNLSQSATSGVLARLRDYFEDELLVPVGRTLTLTPLAVSLMDPVQQVLLQIQRTIETKPVFDPATAIREFRVMASDFISTVLMGELVRRLAACAPSFTLDIMSAGPTATEQLERAELDLLILPRRFMAEGHPTELLFEESYTCVVWSGNTMVGDTLSLDQYMALGHISSRFGGSNSFEEWFLKNSGYQRRIEVMTNNFTSLPHFVIGSERIATMHTRLARTLARYYPIRLLPPPLEIPKLEMCMQWNRFHDKNPAHIWFRNLLAEVARGGTPESDVGSGQDEHCTAGYALPARIAA